VWVSGLHRLLPQTWAARTYNGWNGAPLASTCVPAQEFNATTGRHLIRGVISHQSCIRNATCACCDASKANFALQLNTVRFDSAVAWAAAQ
jgi:hypothetical protein